MPTQVRRYSSITSAEESFMSDDFIIATAKLQKIRRFFVTCTVF